MSMYTYCPFNNSSIWYILSALGLRTFQFEISPCGRKAVEEPFSTYTLIDTYRILGEKLSSANDAVSILMPMTVSNLGGRFCNLSAYTAKINARPPASPPVERYTAVPWTRRGIGAWPSPFFAVSPPPISHFSLFPFSHYFPFFSVLHQFFFSLSILSLSLSLFNEQSCGPKN